MGLIEIIRTSVYNYWTPKEIRQFSEDVYTYVHYVNNILGHTNHAPIVQLASLEERARELHNKYQNGMYLGAVSVFAGLALVRLDGIYDLKPEIIEKLATPIGFLIAIAGTIHAFRSQVINEDYVEEVISSAEKITAALGGGETPVN